MPPQRSELVPALSLLTAHKLSALLTQADVKIDGRVGCKQEEDFRGERHPSCGPKEKGETSSSSPARKGQLVTYSLPRQTATRRGEQGGAKERIVQLLRLISK